MCVEHRFGQEAEFALGIEEELLLVDPVTFRPENIASLRVLAKLGFRQEGLFRRYLDVDGEWRDHLCFAMTAEEPPTGGLVGRIVAAGRAERA